MVRNNGAALIFGLGYSAQAPAARLAARGWRVTGTSRDGRPGTIAFDDREAVTAAIAGADYILSSVPPEGDADPVLAIYGPRWPVRGLIECFQRAGRFAMAFRGFGGGE